METNRQSAAKTLHKPLRGFEFRYVIYSDGKVYDKYKNVFLKEFKNRVTLTGINDKSYSIDINKLLSSTFSETNLLEYEKVKGHENYLINKTGSLYNTKTKKYISTTIKNGYMRYNVNWKRRLVHEVLADQFIENPNNYNSVRLLNEKIENNSSFKGLFTSLDDLKKQPLI